MKREKGIETVLDQRLFAGRLFAIPHDFPGRGTFYVYTLVRPRCYHSTLWLPLVESAARFRSSGCSTSCLACGTLM